MIYPLSLEPKDVNATLVRIADSHNSDIDFMENEIGRMKEQTASIENRFAEYQDRWDRYQDSYKETLHAFYAMNGNLSIGDMQKHLQWNKRRYSGQ
jgi:hypothetical protein